MMIFDEDVFFVLQITAEEEEEEEADVGGVVEQQQQQRVSVRRVLARTATPTPEELSLELGNGNAKKISLLGSTGSIGTQTLDIVEEHPDNLERRMLAAGGTSSWRRSRSKSSNRKWFRCKMGTTSRN